MPATSTSSSLGRRRSTNRIGEGRALPSLGEGRAVPSLGEGTNFTIHMTSSHQLCNSHDTDLHISLCYVRIQLETKRKMYQDLMNTIG